MHKLPEIKGFFVAPFAPDGEFLGIAFKELTGLSQRWLDAAHQFLRANGNTFRASWGHELADVETRLTSSNGTALVTFYVGKAIVSSHLLLSGRGPETESELTELFLRSLLSVRLVQMTAGNDPFGGARTLAQRPLEVVVFWPADGVADERVEMTHELARHFVGAYFDAQLHGGLGV